MDTLGEWGALIESRYPRCHAQSWDNVGLQVGDPTWPVSRVLVSLDVTRAVIEEATTVEGTLVLAHHPLLFRPLKTLTPTSASAATALLAASHRIAVHAAHTNLDVAMDGAGTSTPVARILELQDTQPLSTSLVEGERLRLVAFVPEEAWEAVADAVTTAGAGSIGDYDRCTFRVAGTGTFRPLAGADPHIGTVGQDTEVEEYRLEVELPRRDAGRVVRALLSAHPYEEVAYDLLPLVDGATHGLGLTGTLPAPMPLRAVAARIRDELPSPHLRFAGEPDRLIHTVAITGGAGDSLIGAAQAAGVDLYVTGDLRHHVTLDAVEEGLAMIDAGHHATEVAALPAWIERLSDGARKQGLQAPVIASSVSTATWH